MYTYVNILAEDLKEIVKSVVENKAKCADFLGFSPKFVYDAVQYTKEVHGTCFTYNDYKFIFVSNSCIKILDDRHRVI